MFVDALGFEVAAFDNQPITLGRVSTITDTDGGADTIVTLTGYDIVLGGHEGDTITASLIDDLDPLTLDDLNDQTLAAPDSGNIVLGDTGYIDYDDDVTLGESDVAEPDDIDEIKSTTTVPTEITNAGGTTTIVEVGGADTIDAGDGDDIVIGGRFGDTIRSRSGDNLVFGDSGHILAATVDSATQAHFDNQPITLGRVATLEDTDGGADTILTLTGYDIVLGGHEGDTITASLIDDLDPLTLDDLNDQTLAAPDSGNIVLGDTGYIDYDDDVTLGESDVAEPDDIDEIKSTTTVPTEITNAGGTTTIVEVGGADTIDAGDGDDIVIGGRFGDTIRSRSGDNLVFGDSGHILAATVDSATQAHFDDHPITLGRVATIEDTDGGADTIRTLTGYDIVLGGHEADNIRASLIIDHDAIADGIDEDDLAVEAADTAIEIPGVVDANIILGDTGYIDYDDDQLLDVKDAMRPVFQLAELEVT